MFISFIRFNTTFTGYSSEAGYSTVHHHRHLRYHAAAAAAAVITASFCQFGRITVARI